MNQFEVTTVRAGVENVTRMGPNMLRKFFETINWMYGEITLLKIERVEEP